MVKKDLKLKFTRNLKAAPLIFSIILLPFLFFGFLKITLMLNPYSNEEYNSLMSASGFKKDETKKEAYQINQEREHVQKDITFLKKGDEMHFRLLADSAKLIFDHQGLKTEIAEHMKHVTCYMQEDFYYLLPDGREAEKKEDGTIGLKNSSLKIDLQDLKPMQIIRKMEAEEGIYYYKSDFFITKNVKIERFLIEGHEFLKETASEKKIMSGIAETAEFCLQGKNLDFKAYKLKAVFHESRDGS